MTKEPIPPMMAIQIPIPDVVANPAMRANMIHAPAATRNIVIQAPLRPNMFTGRSSALQK
jgi:hypothetical protein